MSNDEKMLTILTEYSLTPNDINQSRMFFWSSDEAENFQQKPRLATG